ncbi:MAG TPA: hypothetical protein VFB12_19510 [Ktedonobacteraceae bacterium]|nr:hypothetical protein [Ktedonobacteraceae bacterium]
MENSGIYREFKLFKKRSKILQESVPSFLKDGILVLLSALAYRNSKNGAAKVLALLMGGRTIVKATSRVLFLKPLLTLNEEGISFDPSVPIFDFRMAIAWEEIASIYINEVTITNSQSDKQDTTPKPSLPAILPSIQQEQRAERFLFIVPKDVEAFKRSRGFQKLETFQHGRNLLEIDVRRSIVQVFLEKMGTPFLLIERGLPIPLEELLDRIRTQFADKIQAYGIEILEEQKSTFDAVDIS